MVTLDYSGSNPNIFQSAQNLINSTANQYIVRALDNPNRNGVSGFLFDILEDEEVLLESIITDSYVETNISVQDHIALRPLRFTLKAFVGELVNNTQNALASIFVATQALPAIGGLTPQFSPQDAQFYAKVNTVTQSLQNVVNQATNLYTLFAGTNTAATKQQIGFKYFYQLWQTKQLVSVETPFGNFDDMAIESVRAVQQANTREISDFTVTFKMIRTTSAVAVQLNDSILNQQNSGTLSSDSLSLSGRAAEMTAGVTSLGTINGTVKNSDLINSNFVNKTFNI